MVMDVLGHHVVMDVLGHHVVMDVLGHHVVMDVLGHHVVMDVLGHHVVMDVLGHHVVMVVLGHHVVMDVLGHHVVMDVLGHHVVMDVLGHHVVMDVLGHHVVMDVLGHHVVMDVLGHHVVMDVLGHHVVMDVLGHHVVMDVLGHHVVMDVLGHHVVMDVLGHHVVMDVLGHHVVMFLLVLLHLIAALFITQITLASDLSDTLPSNTTSFASDQTVTLTAHVMTNTSFFTATVEPLESPDTNVTIYFITPTYSRLTQKVDLTSLCQTLMHVPTLVWIVIEDSPKKTPMVTSLLARCNVTSVHMNVESPDDLAIEQRYLGLKWVKDTCKPPSCKGVVYFGDDDNKYDLRLFDEVSYYDGYMSCINACDISCIYRK